MTTHEITAINKNLHEHHVACGIASINISEIIAQIRGSAAMQFPVQLTTVQSRHVLALCDEIERLNSLALDRLMEAERLTAALNKLSAHHNECIAGNVARENALRAELASRG